MIKEACIQNFLSHKKTILEFSPGLNIIVGGSDTGKSAIIRALRWVILNKPVGESFRSNWGGATEVGFSFEKAEVVRYKSDKENSYILTADGNTEIFKAIRTDVPHEVSKVLNLGVNNVQTQFESHFLLSGSPGEVAHHFNTIAHLDSIDIGIGNIKRWIGVASASVTAEEGSIDRLGEELSEYSNIDIIEDDVRRLEEVESSLITAEENEDYFDGVIRELGLIDTEISRYNSILSAELKVDVVIKCITKISELVEEQMDLQNSVDSLLHCSRKIRKEQDVLASESDVDNLLGIYKEITQLSNKEEKLLSSIKYTESVVRAAQQEQLSLNTYEDKWHNCAGEVCPLCGNKIN